ncbi:MAG: molecular chaperone [Desulfobacterales bacterium SG8_35_2]|nr:MAG: molecular chaperone [Desulfobacterales bacterium SG8_35_2]
MVKSKTAAEEFEYRAEMKQLLHLIVHSLYTHPEVFLRELISNASDALNKIRFEMLTNKEVLAPDEKLRIQIDLDEKKNTFSIEDTGIGMTKEELIEKIGTVASSGTLEFLKQMQKKQSKIDANLIGQFGVGFYSVFMVTDQITIETRHANPGSKGYRWVSTGEDKFSIEEIDKQTRGTRIYFELKEEAKDFKEEWKVKSVIKKYSNFVDFPIYVGKEEVNRVGALWHRKKEEVKEDELNEFYKFITNDFNPPLAHLHLDIEGVVNFKALIFIPDHAPLPFMQLEDEKSLQLYSSKIFITDDFKDLLPDYLRFVKGLVDTEDLPLNVSREVTQSSPAVAKIRQTLTSKLLSFLSTWSKSDPTKFEKLYKNFGFVFKRGVSSDYKNKDKIVELLRFESSMIEDNKLTTLKDYVSRMLEDQKEIYYLAGENREMLNRNPNLEYFKKNKIETLLLTDPMDILVVPQIGEYDKKVIKSIDKADIDIKEDKEQKREALNENLSSSLVSVFKETLGDKVEKVVVSKRLVDSPVTLVVGKEGLDIQMEKMMKLMNKDYSGQKKILEINTNHPIIKNLSTINLKDSRDPMLRNSIIQLYESALLLEGNLNSPTEYVNRMFQIMEKATKL